MKILKRDKTQILWTTSPKQIAWKKKLNTDLFLGMFSNFCPEYFIFPNTTKNTHIEV